MTILMGILARASKTDTAYYLSRMTPGAKPESGSIEPLTPPHPSHHLSKRRPVPQKANWTISISTVNSFSPKHLISMWHDILAETLRLSRRYHLGKGNWVAMSTTGIMGKVAGMIREMMECVDEYGECSFIWKGEGSNVEVWRGEEQIGLSEEARGMLLAA
jgi:hypothetical protein